MKKNKDYNGMAWQEILLGFLFLLVTLLFIMVTTAKDKPNNDNNEIKSDLISLSTYNNEVVNLASPDLEGKEYLGDGIYRLFNSDGITQDYNVFNGEYILNGKTALLPRSIFILNFNDLNIPLELTYSYQYLVGTIEGSSPFLRGLFTKMNDAISYIDFDPYGLSRSRLEKNVKNIGIYLYSGNSYKFDNYKFKLQLEKGSQANDYLLPVSALEQHSQLEYQKGYDNGNDYGYNVGHGVGRDTGFNEGYDSGYDFGHYSGFNEGFDEGHDTGFTAGMNDGTDFAYDKGFDKGRNLGYGEGYDYGYDYGQEVGWDLGYNLGLTESPSSNFGSMITSILLGVGTVLGIQLLPNITIGAIIAVPIVFGIIAFVLGRKKE